MEGGRSEVSPWGAPCLSLPKGEEEVELKEEYEGGWCREFRRGDRGDRAGPHVDNLQALALLLDEKLLVELLDEFDFLGSDQRVVELCVV